MHHHNQQQPPAVLPAHMNSQMHQQKLQNNSANNRSDNQSFAAALRSLAKQQDVKDEEMIQQVGESKNPNNNPRVSEKEHEPSRSRGIQYDNRQTDIRNLTSPQPPDKKVRKQF